MLMKTKKRKNKKIYVNLYEYEVLDQYVKKKSICLYDLDESKYE